ncbi:alpha/beta fold hydrolase [Gracilibacillus massiliensis]|uniref:alpha/beta fold hydrolase n=1 Tax=Gracilibacillus massiliensis TaxID=1564956 RepID=UPI00071D3286|nr:alpha/beta hydrolase [Gracilibacillus massiliensis]
MTDKLTKRNNIRIIGTGEPIILFAHGFASDQTTWKWITPAFESDHTIILLDYVGSGNSDKSAYNKHKYQSLEGYVEDIVEICDYFEWKNIHFVGHSVGGMIGLLLSIKRPDIVKQLVMIGASPRYLNDFPEYRGGFERQEIEDILEMMEMNFIGWASFLAPVALPKSEGAEKTKLLESQFQSNDPSYTYDFLQATLLSDYRKMLKEVTVPTVILQCSMDSFVPIDVANYMNKHIARSQLHVLSAKGHYPHVSHPEETINTLKKHL